MLRSIAFGGGGTRGILHAGAYRALLETKPDLTFPDGIYGCSIGCVAALAAAYRLTIEQLEHICYTHVFVRGIVDKITIDDVQSLFEKRGLITMECYMNTVATAFEECGIDIRTKTMDDLPQKVFFISSNMTTGRASLLTGKIPVLKALACSACIPLLCVPEELNGDIYLDGAVFTRCVSEVVPPETLVVHISRTDTTITPWTGSLTDILMSAMRGTRSIYMKPNTLRIDNRTITFLEDLTDEQKKAAMDDAYLQARAFFAKRLPKELK